MVRAQLAENVYKEEQQRSTVGRASMAIYEDPREFYDNAVRVYAELSMAPPFSANPVEPAEDLYFAPDAPENYPFPPIPDSPCDPADCFGLFAFRKANPGWFEEMHWWVQVSGSSDSACTTLTVFSTQIGEWRDAERRALMARQVREADERRRRREAEFKQERTKGKGKGKAKDAGSGPAAGPSRRRKAAEMEEDEEEDEL